MNSVKIKRVTGGMADIEGTALEALWSSLRGSLLLVNDNGYDSAWIVWNAMIDRKPALAVRCAGAADIRQAVRFANESKHLTWCPSWLTPGGAIRLWTRR